jgi:pimeloyl-ACP methyl ester carboxylesterase
MVSRTAGVLREIDCHRCVGGWFARVTPSVPLVHRDLGGAGKPPLIILHGMLGSSRNWQTAGRDLAERFHVLAVDLRNHGQSPHADDSSYEAMIADVLAWMDGQRIEKATFLGHSMGGKAAMLIACRFPHRVEGVIIVDIAPKNYHWVAHRGEFQAMNELDLEHLASRAEAELRFEPRVDDWAMRKFLVTNLERDSGGKWRWVVNLPVLTKALPVLERNSLGEHDQFPGPALFITGERSNYVSVGDRELVRKHFPAATFTIVPESGHNPHMEKREAFVRAVLGRDAVPSASAEQR